MIRFPVTLTPDDNDTVLATCPDLPEVTTFGDTNLDALDHAREAIEEAIAARLATFSTIPRPSKGRVRVELSLQTSLKAALYWTMEETEKSRADLQRLMGVHRTQVERLFDPNHATRTDQIEAAFRALGRRLEISVIPDRHDDNHAN